MPLATPHVANLAAGSALAANGFDVMINITCRDRNAIAQQGYLLGAAALGITGAFCIPRRRRRCGTLGTSVEICERCRVAGHRRGAHRAHHRALSRSTISESMTTHRSGSSGRSIRSRASPTARSSIAPIGCLTVVSP